MKRYTIIMLILLAATLLLAQEPPRNLTGEAGNRYATLHWDSPLQNGMVEIFYHDGSPYDAYVQLYNQGYGCIFDLTGNTYSLAEIDFRHSAWGVNGPHNYNIHIVNWDNTSTLHVAENLTTTVDNNWETGVDLGYPEVLTGHVGIFIEPLSNASNDAYPVVDIDAHLDAMSYVVDTTNWSILTPNGASGDFLIDLWLDTGIDRVTAPHASRPSVAASRATGVNTQQLRGPRTVAAPLTRDLLGYNVYKDGALVNDEPIAPSIHSHTVTSLTNDQTYTFYVTAVYDEGESAPSNSVQLTPTAPAGEFFYEGFEGGDIPVGWTLHDEDGDWFDWEVPETEIEAYAGMYCLWSQSYNNGVMQPLTPDNWIVTPAIEIPAECYLKFWMHTQDIHYPIEHLEVWVSTTGSEVEDFQTMLWDITTSSANADWERVSLHLSEYTGQTCYFAWRHCDSNNNYAITIDEIVMTTNLAAGDDIPQPATTLQAWPNPFNPETTLGFSLAAPADVRIDVYDIRGRKAATLLDQPMQAGEHNLVWRGCDDSGQTLSSGVYFARLQAGDESSVRKLLLLK